MSNYKSVDVSFNDLCSSFIIIDISNNYYKNTKISYKERDFTSIVNEKPSSELGYFYNKDGSNIDISQFSIAKYIDFSGNFGTRNIGIPSWCKKIRAVLVGAGGSGGIGTNGKNTYAPAVNINTLNKNVYVYQRQNEKKTDLPGNHTQSTINAASSTVADQLVGNNNNNTKFYAKNDDRLVNTHNINTTYTINQQTNTIANNTQQAGIGGAGGGGGGFIYLNDVDIVDKTLKVDASGGNITLSIGNENYAKVTKGGDASRDASGNATIGNAGTAPITNLSDVSYNGNPGAISSINTGGVSGKSKLFDISSSVSYGNGGNGGNGGIAPSNVTKDVSGNNGSSGQRSFCRIYFLTN
jgi:hypothetical protein